MAKNKKIQKFPENFIHCGISEQAMLDIASGLANTVLVINPEVSTPFVNFTHRDKHFIFGDGCAATVVQKDSTSDKAFKIIDRK